MKALCVIAAGFGLAAWAFGVPADAPPAPAPGAAPPAPKVSGPFTHGNLSIFLLHGPDAAPNQVYLTLQEAIDQKKVVVHETSEVNALSVENRGDVPVFLQTGDIVKGGKQDRAIAMDLVVPAGARVGLPSFCVEAGRWRQRGAEAAGEFNKSDNQVAGKGLKQAINSARQQDKVWQEVQLAQQKLAKNVGQSVQSGTSPSSLQLTLEDKKLLEKLAAYEKDLTDLLKGKTDVIGVAVAINGQVEGAEVYGSAALCAKLWPKLLRSAATDALAEFDEKKPAAAVTTAAVEAFLTDAAKGPAQEVDFTAADRTAQQTANVVNRAPQQDGAQQQVRVPANAQPPAPPAAAPATPQTPPRVRIWRYDAAKAILVECRDKEQPGVIIHRSYIAK